MSSLYISVMFVAALANFGCASNDSPSSPTAGGASGSGGVPTGSGGVPTGSGGVPTGSGGVPGAGGGTPQRGGAGGVGGSAGGAVGGGTMSGGVAGTGGEAGAAGSSTDPASQVCEAGCIHVAAAGCGDLAEADCAGICAPREHCVAEFRAADECLAGGAAVECVDGASVAVGCSAENKALTVCMACVVRDDDAPCDACTRSSCCDELQGYWATSDVDAFSACIGDCADESCVDACIAESPDAGSAYQVSKACEAKLCVAECG